VIILSIFWGWVSAVQAQDKFQDKGTKCFLWTAANEKSAIYVLGSVHFLASESFPLAGAIENAYSSSKTIVFETDIDGFNAPASQAEMSTLGLIPEGQTLQQVLPEQTYSSLKNRVERLGLPMELFDRLKPWLCALTLTAMELQRLGLEPKYGIDHYFFNKAKKDGKQILFLESVSDQLRLFTEMSKEQEASFLQQTLEDIDVLETKSADLIGAWTSGDADRLRSIVEIGFKGHAEIYEKMVVQRNKNWATQIDRLIQQGGNALVVVGAAHLVGEESVLRLLGSRGYEIKQR